MKYQIEIWAQAFFYLQADPVFVENHGPVIDYTDPENPVENPTPTFKQLFDAKNDPGGPRRYFYHNIDPNAGEVGRYAVTEEWVVENVLSLPKELITVGLQIPTDHLSSDQMKAEQEAIDSFSTDNGGYFHTTYLMPGRADKAWECIGRWPIPEVVEPEVV